MSPLQLTLDQWLQEHYQLQKKDLTIRMPKIVRNASRYSKESTRTDQAGTIDQWVDNWLDEVKRSETEDAEGKDRKGVDVYLAESMHSTRMRLNNLGESIPLDRFPFRDFPESVREHVIRALQKEIGSAIRKVKGLSMIQGAQIYSDHQLSAILQRECTP